MLADDPETLHDMPLLLARTAHQLLDVREVDGEFAFVIEVVG
ncbi:MAG: sulfurtransferase TusA family protein [Poseidonia sp.]